MLGSNDDVTIYKLRNSISGLREERDNLLRDVANERQIYNEMELEMMKMRREQEYLIGLVREKEAALLDYDKMIQESEVTLNKLVDNSNRLLQTLDYEATKLRTAGPSTFQYGQGAKGY